ncbi:MAG: tetratricopeptide repeat protein [Candidatus Omnitrophica bacterium]|nr:tetratricopeptide repeat protein [Candidatus Omnitrophota bacterium]
MRNKSAAILSLLFSFSFLSAFAETIVLKSGKTIEGKILEKTEKSVKVDISGIPITYYLDEIQTIDSEKINSYSTSSGASQGPLIKSKNNYIYDKGARPGPLYEAYRICNEEGLKYINSGDYSSAIKQFEKAIEMIPTESVAYINLGISYKKTGKPQEAIKSLEKALSLDPEDYQICYNLGNVYFELLKNYQEAEQWYLKAIQKNPSASAPYGNLGVVYIYLGKYAQAKENLEKSKQLSEQHGDREGVYFAEQNLKTIPAERN